MGKALDRVMNLRMRLITREEEEEHAVGTTTTPAPQKKEGLARLIL